ncbi:MAG: TylF/MycF/NovP-related O-methyltransferase [Bacteroidota bacterium]
MDNYFITQPPYTRAIKPSFIKKWVGKGLRYLKLGDLTPLIDPFRDMNNVEQRMNYYHLVNQIIAANVKGDLVELGAFTGFSAMLFQNVLQQNQSDKKLHLYDSFEIQFSEHGDIQEILKANFLKAGLNLPTLHKGYFQDTLPTQLPQEIAFVHIDCGHGGDKFEHRDIMIYCLTEVYPKMTKGAICLLTDYIDRNQFPNGFDCNPGVYLGASSFLKDKPEKMVALYGNQLHHAYFKKE